MPVTLRGQMVKTRATDQQALEETFLSLYLSSG